jgi:hypothetical protein
MAIAQRISKLSKLAFFLSLGLAATIIDACGGKSNDEGKDPEGSGGSSSTDQNNTTEPAGGGASTSEATGGSPATGGTSAVGGRPNTRSTGLSTQEPKDAGLWDVICE